MKRTARWLTICLLSAAAAACSRYQFKLNDRVLFKPPPLFTDYTIADKGLHSCIAQTIADRKITKASQLKSLACTNAGIHKLDGIDTFTGLKAIDLDHNAITDVAPLASLPRLTELHLADNALHDVSALAALTHLEKLDLTGNTGLTCATAKSLAVSSLTLPKHCKPAPAAGH